MSVIKHVCKAMERVAPLRLAEKWDNVGLLLEAPTVRPNARRVLLTIDLTTAVTDEALASDTCCVVSYHTPLFKPISALTLADPLQTSLLRCAANGISVYAPHTALDSVKDGINTWLARGLYGDDVRAFERGVSYLGPEAEDGSGGQGRVAAFEQPQPLNEVVKCIKDFLKLEQVQVAQAATYATFEAAQAAPVRSVAICAGSGGSMLLGHPADVYFTGEMAHHEVLAAVASGHHVVLCGHTNTERGYLPTLARRLTEELTAVATEAEGEGDREGASVLRALRVDVSAEDRHPLVII